MTNNERRKKNWQLIESFMAIEFIDAVDLVGKALSVFIQIGFH